MKVVLVVLGDPGALEALLGVFDHLAVLHLQQNGP